MTKCQDCSAEAKRRARCRRCRLLVCSWCHHHVHAWVRGPFSATRMCPGGSTFLGANRSKRCAKASSGIQSGP